MQCEERWFRTRCPAARRSVSRPSDARGVRSAAGTAVWPGVTRIREGNDTSRSAGAWQGEKKKKRVKKKKKKKLQSRLSISTPWTGDTVRGGRVTPSGTAKIKGIIPPKKARQGGSTRSPRAAGIRERVGNFEQRIRKLRKSMAESLRVTG